MKLPFAYVNMAQLVAVRADFVKHEMRLVVAVRLDDKALAMREVLSGLVTDKAPLLVSFEIVEPSLGDLPLFAAAELESRTSLTAEVAAAVAGLKNKGETNGTQRD